MERLLDIEELSKMLGVKRATIYAWIYQHKIPHIKLSKRLVRFRESEILDWIEKQSVSPFLLTTPRKKLKGSFYKLPMQTDYIEKIVKVAKEHVLCRASQN
ncbi:MAG: helix-turn-helix domain-containing protein [Nitrospirota bacterium]